MLSRKYYIAIAKIIAWTEKSGRISGSGRKFLVEEFCNYFYEDNPNFDESRFATMANGRKILEIEEKLS